MMKWEMKYHEYVKFCNETTVEGFNNGHKFEDFQKGQIVGYFDRSHREGEKPEFKIGKVVEVLRAKNAAGKDTIRKVTVKVGDVNYSASGHKHIKAFLFIKDVQEEEKPRPEKPKSKPATAEAKVDDVTENGAYEVLEVERAMSPKNPKVKQLLTDGWNYVGKIWNGEKNMYIATLRRLKEGN